MIHDDANAWFQSQGQEIQDFEVPPSPDEYQEPVDPAEEEQDSERPYGDVPTITNDDVRNLQNARIIAQPTATLIVSMMDIVLPLLVAVLVKGCHKEDVRLTDSERQDLENAWSTYLGDKQVMVSPGTQLLIAIVTIYGVKMVDVVMHRQHDKELQALQQENQRQQLQIEELKRMIDEKQ